MTPAEIARLLGAIRRFDNRIGDPDPHLIAAWLDSSRRRSWDLESALDAVGEYYAETRRPPLIMPGDITHFIRRRRNANWQD